jgi:predicted RNase H-like nuclease (RuvC/YqgF family)
MEDEPLMNLRPKTPEEKILWLEFEKKSLEEENRKLNMEIGMLQSEIDELKHQMKQEEKGALIIKNKTYKQQIRDLENRLKDLKKENSQYLERIIKLQTP